MSREDGDKQESESIGNQRKIIERYIEENNLTLIDEYVDDGVSGTTFDRPQFNRLITDIENQKLKALKIADMHLGRGIYLIYLKKNANDPLIEAIKALKK